MLRLGHPSKLSYASPVWALRTQIAAQYIHALAYVVPLPTTDAKILRANAMKAIQYDNAEILHKSYEQDGARGPVTVLPKPFNLIKSTSPNFIFHDADYIREVTSIRLPVTPEAGIAVLGHARLSATCGLEIYAACQDARVSRDVEDDWRMTTDDRQTPPTYRYSPSGILYNYAYTAQGKTAKNLTVSRISFKTFISDENFYKRDLVRSGLIKALLAGHASFYHFDDAGREKKGSIPETL